MRPPVVERLGVPGASLYTESRGDGPLLVCIVGGNGDSEVFSALAGALAEQLTVVTYDRRGFARSPLDGPVDAATRFAQDVDDAVRVIERHGGGPAHVLGSSSGAIVGLELLARHPGRVRTLIAHEPPMVMLLPDAATWLSLFDDVYTIYLASGPEVAMSAFTAVVGLHGSGDVPAPAEDDPPIAAMLARMPANQAWFLEHELLRYPRLVPDLAAIRPVADKLVAAVGRDSPDGVLAQPMRILAAGLGVSVVELAGGHLGYVTHAAELAAQLAAVLR